MAFEISKDGLREVVAERNPHSHLGGRSAVFWVLAASTIAQRNPGDQTRSVFAVVDDDQTGKIRLANLKRVARGTGELEAVIAEFDTGRAVLRASRSF